jgi:hypothetical protein
MKFSRKTTRRILLVGAVFVFLFILYKVLGSYNIMEGQQGKQQIDEAKKKCLAKNANIDAQIATANKLKSALKIAQALQKIDKKTDCSSII